MKALRRQTKKIISRPDDDSLEEETRNISAVWASADKYVHFNFYVIFKQADRNKIWCFHR